jgi:hypothetical protein
MGTVIAHAQRALHPCAHPMSRLLARARGRRGQSESRRRRRALREASCGCAPLPGARWPSWLVHVALHVFRETRPVGGDENHGPAAWGSARSEGGTTRVRPGDRGWARRPRAERPGSCGIDVDVGHLVSGASRPIYRHRIPHTCGGSRCETVSPGWLPEGAPSSTSEPIVNDSSHE